MPSYVPCKKNDTNGYIFYVSLVSQANTKVFQANPTLAAGDVKIAIDDGPPANLNTLPAVDADFTKRVKVTLNQSETNGDNLTIIFSDAAGDEWCDLEINIHTAARQVDDLAYPATSGRSLGVETDGHVHADLKEWLGVAPLALSSQLIQVLESTLESRLTEARAANLDELGAVNIPADIDTLLNRLSALRAAYLDNLSAGAVALEATLTTMKQTAAGAFDRDTDSLEAIRDRGDAAWVTGGGGSAPTAQEIWTYVKRTLTSRETKV